MAYLEQAVIRSDGKVFNMRNLALDGSVFDDHIETSVSIPSQTSLPSQIIELA